MWGKYFYKDFASFPHFFFFSERTHMMSPTKQDKRNGSTRFWINLHGCTRLLMTHGTTHPQHFHFMRIFTRLIHFQFTQQPITGITNNRDRAWNVSGFFLREITVITALLLLFFFSLSLSLYKQIRIRDAMKISPNMSFFCSYSENGRHYTKTMRTKKYITLIHEYV